MTVYSRSDLKSVSSSAPVAYHEFLRVPALSAGIYRLGAGAADHQKPHTEDEVYYVLAGKARFNSGSAPREIGPGDFIYVPAGEPHRFSEITEPLELLVVFVPAEGTRDV